MKELAGPWKTRFLLVLLECHHGAVCHSHMILVGIHSFIWSSLHMVDNHSKIVAEGRFFPFCQAERYSFKRSATLEQSVIPTWFQWESIVSNNRYFRMDDNQQQTWKPFCHRELHLRSDLFPSKRNWVFSGFSDNQTHYNPHIYERIGRSLKNSISPRSSWMPPWRCLSFPHDFSGNP